MDSQGGQMQGAIRHQGGTAVSQGQSILLPGKDTRGSPSTWQGSTSGRPHTATTSPGSCTKATRSLQHGLWGQPVRPDWQPPVPTASPQF